MHQRSTVIQQACLFAWLLTLGIALSAGVAAAGKLGSSSLLDTVRLAFVHGMDLMLWTCGGIAVACAILAVTFLRTRPQDAGDVTSDSVPGSLPVA